MIVIQVAGATGERC